jgi:signal transduction histidine kinase/ligand-binding sensor domain-containing protein/DNA-binding response OmpR family regulator
MNYKHCFVVIVAVCNFTILIGQRNLEFANITRQQGLSNTDINAIVQDKDGFIWFGTEYGLNRYDGYQIKVFRNTPGDSTSLPDNSINCLYVDHEGVLWIGTIRGGLSQYKKNSNSFSSYRHDPSNPHTVSYNYITYITEDIFNNLWVATLEGLNLYNKQNNSFTQFIDNKSLGKMAINKPSGNLKNIRSISSDKQGNLWIGYERDGLGMLDIKKGIFTHYPLPARTQKVPGDNSIQFILDEGNELWLASRFSGILVFNKTTKQYRSLNSKQLDPRVNYLLPDHGNIWIATKNGLYAYSKQTGLINSFFHQECNHNSLSNNSISCLFMDRQGILWAGSLQGGVNYVINKKGFNVLRKDMCQPVSLSQQSVSAVLKDNRNNLWVGYFDNGIDIIDLKTNTKKFYFDLPTAKGTMPTGTIFCIFQDSKGRIWLGTYASGIFMYEPSTGQFRNFNHQPSDSESLSGNDVRSICEDKEHQLWLAIHGRGVNRFNPETGKTCRISYPQNNYGFSDAHNWVYKVYIDSSNNLWVTSVDGVSLSPNLGKTFTNYHHTQRRSNNESLDVIWTLYDDGKQLWLGSSMGLSVFDKNKKVFTKVISKNDGLPSDAITGILPGPHNYLWISTYNGLVKLNPKDFKDIKVFDQTDGLQGNQFFFNACYRATSGEMYFGGQDGLTYFLPDSIKEYKFIPTVVITDFKLFNKSENFVGSNILSKNISETKEITLKYSQNVLTFDFVALNFEEPEKNQYAYQLEGFEKDWNVAVNKREATYTNLSPGTYIFHVKASNNDGIWNNKGVSVKIHVLPPLWLSKLAFSLYILLIITSLILYKRFIQNREKLKRQFALQHLESEKQIEMNNVRLKFFTNISHEFRTSLSMIIGPTEILMGKKQNFTPIQEQQVSLIKSNAQRLLRLINQLLDLRKIESGNLKLYPSPGDLISFCREIAQSFETFSQQKNIGFLIQTNCDSLYAWFDVDKLEKIVYNLLSNAFKYTPQGGYVQLSIMVAQNGLAENLNSKSVCIEVSDTGIGIPAESINKIFESFYQVDSAEHNKGGTGIGLALVKELVEMHNGTILVKSNQKKPDALSEGGTTFTITLPLDIRDLDEDIQMVHNLEEIKVVPLPPTRKNDTQKPLLLVVEDNADLRSFIIGIMLDDFRVIEATNGLEGLQAAFGSSPDLIISDIMMPGMQGTELCKTLKTDKRTSHIPIILLTALSSIEVKISGYEIGADDYITKPFNAKVLKIRVCNLIESRHRMRERFSKQIFVEPKEIAITSVDEKFLNKAMEVVEKHMDDPFFDVEVFFKEMYVSRTLLHNKLKALTDLSATEFIKTIRLKRASRLLYEGKLSISEVSIMVGFNSRNYFTKCFTEQFGISPSEYEKTVQ